MKIESMPIYWEYEKYYNCVSERGWEVAIYEIADNLKLPVDTVEKKLDELFRAGHDIEHEA